MYDTYGNIPLMNGETADDGWARYQAQLAERQATQARVDAMRAAMPQPTAQQAPVAAPVSAPAGMTPEQHRAIAAMWTNPALSIDQKKAQMAQFGIGVTDVMAATGQDLNAIADAFKSGGDWGGLHYGDGGVLTGTDWGGPTVRSVPAAQDPFAMVGGSAPKPAGTYQPPANVVQPGTSPGWPGNTGGPAQPYPQQQAPQYQMPVLNALYQAQQQRMTAPVPRFNFQQQGPLTATAAANPQQSTIMAGEPPPGALTTAISGT